MRQELLQYRARLDANMQQAQVRLQQNAITQQQFAQIRQQYMIEVVNVETRWKVLQEREQIRSNGALLLPLSQRPLLPSQLLPSQLLLNLRLLSRACSR